MSMFSEPFEEKIEMLEKAAKIAAEFILREYQVDNDEGEIILNIRARQVYELLCDAIYKE